MFLSDNNAFFARFSKRTIQIRAPFAELTQSVHNGAAEKRVSKTWKISNDDRNDEYREKFMEEGDPKMSALMQQAQLLSSLAAKVNTEKTEQSLEYAWRVLQEYLDRNKENGAIGYNILDMDLELDDIEDLIAGLQSSNDSNRLRKLGLHESSGNPESIAGSTLRTSRSCDNSNQTQTETITKHHDRVKVSGKYKDENRNPSALNPSKLANGLESLIDGFIYTQETICSVLMQFFIHLMNDRRS